MSLICLFNDGIPSISHLTQWLLVVRGAAFNFRRFLMTQCQREAVINTLLLTVIVSSWRIAGSSL